MHIRNAQPSDINNIVELAKEMVSDTPFSSVIKDKIEKILQVPHALSLVAEHEEDGLVGFFCGILDKQFFTGQLRAMDLALFVDEKHRGSSAAIKFVKTFENWAKQKGATQAWLGQSVGKEIEKTKEFYERLGYHMMGVNTMKELH